MRRFTALITLLSVAACSKGGNDEILPEDSAVVAAPPLADTMAPVVIRPETGPPRCTPKLGTYQGSLTFDSLEVFIRKVRECDPLKAYFTTEGRVTDDDRDGTHYLAHLHPSARMLDNVQSIAGYFAPLKAAFENLAILQRREILRPAIKLVVPMVVEYVHRNYLDDFLLKLDWQRDIAWVDPAWYEGTNWPENRFESTVPTLRKSVGEDSIAYIPATPARKLSKVDLWIRMFWLRRGELIFRTAQEEVKAALIKK